MHFPLKKTFKPFLKTIFVNFRLKPKGRGRGCELACVASILRTGGVESVMQKGA